MPTLAKVLQAILDVLSNIRVVQSFLQQLGLRIDSTAQEHEDYRIESYVSGTSGLMQHEDYGAINAYNQRLDILAALAALPDPVNLPVVPPAGYGGPEAQAVWDDPLIEADDVYNQNYEYSPTQLLGYLATDAFLRMECQGVPDPRNPDFLVVGGSSPDGVRSTIGWIGFAGVARVPPITWASWDGSASLVAFLNSQQGTYTFSAVGPDGATTPGYAWVRASIGNDTWYVCRWPQFMLPSLAGIALPPDFTEVTDAIDAATSTITLAISASETAVENYVNGRSADIESYVNGRVADVEAAVAAAITTINGHTDSEIAGAVATIDGHTDDQVAVTNGKVDALASDVATVQGDLTAGVADILAAIAGIVPGGAPGAPVWPGLAGVTLGTPVALSDSVAIDAAMDGVIVAVTTPPAKVGLRSIGGMSYDYNCGELTFITDQGDAEPWVYLGFRAAIFTPKTMAQAGGVRMRVLGGAEGTVTPWTITP